MGAPAILGQVPESSSRMLAGLMSRCSTCAAGTALGCDVNARDQVRMPYNTLRRHGKARQQFACPAA